MGVRSQSRNICNNFRVRGPRYYYQGDTFNCPVQGFVSFVTVASLNQRKLIVVSEYCLAPVTVAVVFLLCDPLALHIIHTCFSHRASIFFHPPTHSACHRYLFSLFYNTYTSPLIRPHYRTPRSRYSTVYCTIVNKTPSCEAPLTCSVIFLYLFVGIKSCAGANHFQQVFNVQNRKNVIFYCFNGSNIGYAMFSQYYYSSLSLLYSHIGMKRK